MNINLNLFPDIAITPCTEISKRRTIMQATVYGSKVLKIIFSKLKNPEGTAHSKRHFTLALSDHDSLLNVLIGPTQTCMHTKHY
jgi:hypothetical protein